MQVNSSSLSQTNQTNIIDSPSINSNSYNDGLDTGNLYPVSDIMTAEFKGIQVLHYIEEKMSLYKMFKSLLMGNH